MNTVSLSGEGFLELMQAVFEKNAVFRFRATGFSMSPFIKDGDIVSLAPASGEILKTGDVAAFQNRVSGSVFVHRIIRESNDKGLCLKGDNLAAPDGYFKVGDALGRVIKVERSGYARWFGGWGVAILSRYGFLRVLMPALRKIKEITGFK